MFTIMKMVILKIVEKMKDVFFVDYIENIDGMTCNFLNE